jgi:nitroreductase
MIDARSLFDDDDRRALVAEANLAPSVHNIQPAQFRFAEDGAIHIVEHPRRRIPVGDPTGADNRKSLGAAAEGLVMALAARNVAAKLRIDGGVRVELDAEAAPDPLRVHVPQRATWRGAFAQASIADARALADLARFDDLTVITNASQRAEIAALYDAVSLITLRDNAYREELVSWMRLARSHPDWARDGLNAEAMALSSFEAFGAGVVMGKAFRVLDRMGLAGPLIAEGAKVKGAAGVVLFHRPATESDYDTGRRFYRVWLEITARGLALCPMSVLADSAEAAARVKKTYAIAEERKLVTAFRVGRLPENACLPERVRLPVDELIV